MPDLVEPCSEVFHFVPEPRNLAEIAILPAELKTGWLKETLKEIKNLINNTSFLMEYPCKGEPVTPCMNVYKETLQDDGSIYKLKLRVVIREDLYDKW